MNTEIELNRLLKNLKNHTADFSQVMTFIASNYDFTTISFQNGQQFNDYGENEGSAKVFALGKLFNLSAEETLLLFAEHYQDVLSLPDGNNHTNIRNFIQHGWDGLVMKEQPLTKI